MAAPRGPLVIVGDALLDVDVVGRAERLAPDAPVPVLDDIREHPRPGGAALAAVLAARDGHDIVLVTPLADDEAGKQLRALLDDVHVVSLTYNGATAVKRRVRAGGQSLLRLDSGERGGRIGALTDAGDTVLRRAAAVLVSDYGRGVSAVPSVRRAVAALPHRVPVVWDPHPHGAAPVSGARLVTPNSAEATKLAERHDVAAAGPDTALSAVARRAAALVSAWQAAAVSVTLGARGALLSYGTGAPLVVPAPAVGCLDPCGAGDRFAATAAILLRSGAVTTEAVQGAVEAASHFVATGGAGAHARYAGTGDADLPVTSPGDRPAYRDVVAPVRARGGVVVATGGCFDLVHAGHVATLRAARRLGDCLVVCVNSDASVRRLKGPARPLVRAEDRVRVLEALGCVDAVVEFDDDTPEAVLRRLRPDVWAKGGDYAGADLPEAALLRQWGGQAVVLPYVEGRSTTQLVQAVAATPAGAARIPTERA
jgi:rfaE bifunctional protein nucleotidyltransferase chain/domain/rfaE bifunctional protein kinase chain/domain